MTSFNVIVHSMNDIIVIIQSIIQSMNDIIVIIQSINHSMNNIIVIIQSTSFALHAHGEMPTHSLNGMTPKKGSKKGVKKGSFLGVQKGVKKGVKKGPFLEGPENAPKFPGRENPQIRPGDFRGAKKCIFRKIAFSGISIYYLYYNMAHIWDPGKPRKSREGKKVHIFEGI